MNNRDQASTLEPGARLGPYEILSRLGAGGMGEVFRARDSRLLREVAVKVLPAAYGSDRDRIRRFEQEAAAAGSLSHPNLLAIYDVGMQGGSPYIVSELLEGETLACELASGRLPLHRVFEHAVQIVRGLAAAHEKGVVHRDIKPSNVFVTRDGLVKILDFGLAKLIGDLPETSLTSSPTSGTAPGAVLGTLGYMSPEQLRGLPADPRSDIFSFGAILYEMLCGRRAFPGESAADIMSAVLRDDPPAFSQSEDNASSDLRRVVLHCLEKNPERRYRSAHDIAFDLESLSARSSRSDVSKTSPADLHGLPMVAAGLVLALAVAAGYFAGAQKESGY